MQNVTIRCKVRHLLRELDKIDPEWYNSGVVAEYRKFGGNIYNTWGPNKRQPNCALYAEHHSRNDSMHRRSKNVSYAMNVAGSGPNGMLAMQGTGRMPSAGVGLYIYYPRNFYTRGCYEQ